MSDDDAELNERHLRRLRILEDWLERGAPKIGRETLDNARLDVKLAYRRIESLAAQLAAAEQRIKSEQTDRGSS